MAGRGSAQTLTAVTWDSGTPAVCCPEAEVLRGGCLGAHAGLMAAGPRPRGWRRFRLEGRAWAAAAVPRSSVATDTQMRTERCRLRSHIPWLSGADPRYGGALDGCMTARSQAAVPDGRQPASSAPGHGLPRRCRCIYADLRREHDVVLHREPFGRRRRRVRRVVGAPGRRTRAVSDGLTANTASESRYSLAASNTCVVSVR